jgi:ABC-type lipoprotein export system ATPase subunit
MLKLAGISKTFKRADGDVTALQQMSLNVDAGEFIAVRGPSGTGKTTLLLIAGGLLRPDTGSVTCSGQDVYASGAEKRTRLRAERIGFVFQQYHLVPYLSVLENVMIPALTGTRSGVEERARELLSKLGMEQRMDHRPGELSAGEKQRTAFARAMVNTPGVLLVDEPTGNLDKANADVLLNALKGFAGDGGSVLMATHDDTAAACAARVVEIGSRGT